MSMFYALALVLALYVAHRLTRRANALPLPPGPRGLPFGIGNLFDMPTIRPWETYADLGRTYGMLRVFSWPSTLT